MARIPKPLNLLLLVLFFIAWPSKADDTKGRAPLLWEPSVVALEYETTPQAVGKALMVVVHTNMLENDKNDAFTLTLPNRGPIVVQRTRFAHEKEDVVWEGVVKGEPNSDVMMSASGAAVAADISLEDGTIFAIRYVGKDHHAVEQLDVRKFPPEQGAVRFGSINASSTPKSPNIDIDVLTVYTNGASNYLAQFGPAMRAFVNLLVLETNRSFRRSEVQQQIKPVAILPTNYKEKRNIALDQLLLVESDSSVDVGKIHEQRRNAKADIVVLLTKKAGMMDSCGQSSQMHVVSTNHCTRAYAVVPMNCAVWNRSFAHELGHIMGADHNHEGTTNGPPYDFSYGHLVQHSVDQHLASWVTIMGELGTCTGNCRRILNWSNPQVDYRGEKTGVPGYADNAMTLNRTGSAVSNFFPSPDCN